MFTKPPATYMSNPVSKAEMGLAVETWLHIVSSLARDPLALLACALTCRYLRGPAQEMIQCLLHPIISTYHDLDTLMEDIRESPALTKVIRSLDIRAKDDMTSIPVFSVIPFRLGRMLTRLETLQIGYFPNGHSAIAGLSRSWSFYGRAFCCVTTLEFRDVSFPSFYDFTSLITSFPALTTLSIHHVECRSREVPVSVRRHYERPLELERLTVSESTSEWNACVWFCQTLAWWLIKRRRTSVKTLNINYTIPTRQELLQGFQRNLQKLELQCPVSSFPGGQ
ncbi:hypothetical protein NLI96_g3829 [Meripilus lineatus]|uniref:F-box domain-containing protein n=1 Tax=Meripilus lineatus TaxID=2056292 RepID=A0AAD5V6A4_9APHY|nr:hypothetical protein NLI96_g3829 [Physisporinus lineatus]